MKNTKIIAVIAATTFIIWKAVVYNVSLSFKTVILTNKFN
jgi:hypothetical protein